MGTQNLKLRFQFEVKTFKPSGKYYTTEYETFEVTAVQGDSSPISIYMDDAVEAYEAAHPIRSMYAVINHELGFPCMIMPNTI